MSDWQPLAVPAALPLSGAFEPVEWVFIALLALNVVLFADVRAPFPDRDLEASAGRVARHSRRLAATTFTRSVGVAGIGGRRSSLAPPRILVRHGVRAVPESGAPGLGKPAHPVPEPVGAVGN